MQTNTKPISITGAERREFSFSAKDFAQIRKLIYERAGIALSPAKHEMVYSRLSRRLRAHGLSSFKDYLVLLQDGDNEEWEAFINSLTTNLTTFFREHYHFPILAEHVGRQRHRHDIKLWCAASSTGEEPYSMAMTMVDLFGTFTPPVKILATDVDTHVLATARQGIYSMEKLAKLPPGHLKRFFLKGTGSHQGSARVRDELREMISFRQLNLLDPAWSAEGLTESPYDAIFCRNVMIYFDKPTQYRILQRFMPLLRPGGLLFAGHSENFFYAADLFKLRSKTVYEVVSRARDQGPSERARSTIRHVKGAE